MRIEDCREASGACSWTASCDTRRHAAYAGADADAVPEIMMLMMMMLPIFSPQSQLQSVACGRSKGPTEGKKGKLITPRISLSRLALGRHSKPSSGNSRMSPLSETLGKRLDSTRPFGDRRMARAQGERRRRIVVAVGQWWRWGVALGALHAKRTNGATMVDEIAVRRGGLRST
jgi:hypothetical protein